MEDTTTLPELADELEMTYEALRRAVSRARVRQRAAGWPVPRPVRHATRSGPAVWYRDDLLALLRTGTSPRSRRSG